MWKTRTVWLVGICGETRKWVLKARSLKQHQGDRYLAFYSDRLLNSDIMRISLNVKRWRKSRNLWHSHFPMLFILGTWRLFIPQFHYWSREHVTVFSGVVIALWFKSKLDPFKAVCWLIMFYENALQLPELRLAQRQEHQLVLKAIQWVSAEWTVRNVHKINWRKATKPLQ